MEISPREWVALIHGLVLGGFLLLALYGLGTEAIRSRFVSGERSLNKTGLHFEKYYLIGIVAIAWIVVFTGAYVVYPWYRAVPTDGVVDLALFPRRLLLSNPATAEWHNIGMEWKEHIAWIAAVLMTTVAFLKLQAPGGNPMVRQAVMVFIFTAFFSAGVAGFFGAMLTKHAPIKGVWNLNSETMEKK